MKAKLFTKYAVAMVLLFSFFMSSCKKNEIDSVREPAVVDIQAPVISNVSMSSAVANRGDSVDITFTAKDDGGLYFLKVEYVPWNIVKSITLDGTVKEYTYKERIAIPANATIQSHNLKLGAIDVGYNEVTSEASVNIERKPGVYTEMFVYGDVVLAGSLGKGWDYNYAEAMASQPDATLGIEVYNYKTNGEFLLISARSSSADILGSEGSDKVAKNATGKLIIPAIGYYRISFNPDFMTYKIDPINTNTTVLNMWVIGEGLVEFGGVDWDLGHAIPMVLSIPDNPNIFIGDVTRTTSAEGVIRVLNSLSWNGEIGWVSILDVDNIADNNFELSSSSSKKYIYINGHAGEKYVIKVDVFLNKGIAVKQ